MAQIILDENTGLFDVIENGQIVQDSTLDGVTDDLSNQEISEENYLEYLQPDALEDQTYFQDDQISLLSVTSGTNSYTVQTFQNNIAANRNFDEHYLIWAVRTTSGNQHYWKYYVVTGRHIEKNGENYSYENADWYEYYNYNNVINYTKEQRTGTVSGSTYLVYSDLYFDYVGTDPVDHLTPYLVFFFGLIITILLLRSRKYV